MFGPYINIFDYAVQCPSCKASWRWTASRCSDRWGQPHCSLAWRDSLEDRMGVVLHRSKGGSNGSNPCGVKWPESSIETNWGWSLAFQSDDWVAIDSFLFVCFDWLLKETIRCNIKRNRSIGAYIDEWYTFRVFSVLIKMYMSRRFSAKANTESIDVVWHQESKLTKTRAECKYYVRDLFIVP